MIGISSSAGEINAVVWRDGRDKQMMRSGEADERLYDITATMHFARYTASMLQALSNTKDSGYHDRNLISAPVDDAHA